MCTSGLKGLLCALVQLLTVLPMVVCVFETTGWYGLLLQLAAGGNNLMT